MHQSPVSNNSIQKFKDIRQRHEEESSILMEYADIKVTNIQHLHKFN